MKIVKQDAKVLIPESPMKHIEKIGRICYKSEDKIADGSDRKFIRSLYKNKHHAMLEHFRFIMEVDENTFYQLALAKPRHFEFTSPNQSMVVTDRYLISCNARALMDLRTYNRCRRCSHLQASIVNTIIDDIIGHIVNRYGCHELFGIDRDTYSHMFSTNITFIDNNRKCMTEDEWIYHGWMTVDMVTDRGISHEIVRHREETSFAQESTRYCNYGNDKFGKEITVIDQGFNGSAYVSWASAMQKCEDKYFELLDEGQTPQMARSVLPTCLKTEIVMTAPMYEWNHFFDLRMKGTTGKPHPMIEDLSKMIYKQYKEVVFNA